MPITPTGLVVVPASDRISELRVDLDAAFGFPLDYNGTIEGGWTDVVGTVQFDVESGQAILLDSLDPNTASGANLDRIAAGVGIQRRPATASRWSFRVTTATTAVYPAGYTVTAVCSDGVVRTWTTIEDTTVGPVAVPVIFECAVMGPVAVSTMQTCVVTRAFAPAPTVTYDPGDADVTLLGRDRESDTELRVAIRKLRGTVAGPTDPGIRKAVLALPWVRAVSLSRTGPAQPKVTIVPNADGDDQKAQIAGAILASVAYGMVTQGTESLVVPLPDGTTETIRWSVGSTQNVAVVAQVVLSGVTLAQASPAIVSAIEGVFATLDVGSVLRYAYVYSAIVSVSGVVGITVLTLNGGTSDITPVSTSLLVPSPDPVVTT